MEASLGVNNAFVHAVSFEQANIAGEGLHRSGTSRSSSCAADDVNNGDSSALWLLLPPGLRRTLDALSDVPDSDEELEDHPSCLSLEINPAFKASEKTHIAAALVQAPDGVRTPLNSKASAFVPHGPLGSVALAFDPSSSRMVNMPRQDRECLDDSAPDTCRSGPGPRLPAAAGPDGDRPPRQMSALPKPATTVMLRNLPCGLTRKALVWNLNNKGFARLYDFVYVPFDFETKLCMGFAFVNLASGEQVRHLIEAFDGHSDWSPKLSRRTTSKVCRVSICRTQGLAANIERNRNSSVMSDSIPGEFKPALFVGGRQVAFPKPTGALGPIFERPHYSTVQEPSLLPENMGHQHSPDLL